MGQALSVKVIEVERGLTKSTVLRSSTHRRRASWERFLLHCPFTIALPFPHLLFQSGVPLDQRLSLHGQLVSCGDPDRSKPRKRNNTHSSTPGERSSKSRVHLCFFVKVKDTGKSGEDARGPSRRRGDGVKRKSRATQWNGSRRSGCRLVRARLETKARFFSHWPFPLFRPGIRLLMRLDVSGRGIPRFTGDLYRAHL
jgi:hypothetical protein